jgi:hypothetical protein
MEVLEMTEHEDDMMQAFIKRYRCTLTQTKEEMLETHILDSLSPLLRDLTEVNDVFQIRHPVVQVKIANERLDTLVNDINELMHLRQFLRITPDAMHEYNKFRTWEGLTK